MTIHQTHIQIFQSECGSCEHTPTIAMRENNEYVDVDDDDDDDDDDD